MGALIKRSLQQHEDIIAAGAKWFLDVGNSLMAIRDGALYKDSYKTFESYCDGRWGFTRQHAARLIESVVVVNDLSPIGDKLPENEAQARAIAESADNADVRQTVWKATVAAAPKDDDGKPRITAALVKKVAKGIKGTTKPKKKKQKAENVDLPLGREPGEDPPEPEHVPDPALPTDKSGNTLPDRPELLKAFRSRDLFHSCEAARNVIYNNVYEAAALLPNGQGEQLKRLVDGHMKALFHTLAQHEPAYACKTCNGGGCSKCCKRGYTCAK